MASWKWPTVLNKMLEDIPGINTLLNALLKQDPAGTTDVPAGAKRWTDTPNGKQFQVFNGQSWSSVGKLDHDAASVDGHSASTGTTPSTIPVRDADGKIPGDITGNAATASKAKELSEANSISMGGTGATTVEQARANLGTPPKNHASASTEYGAGSSTQYGHLKSHDAPDATLTAATGHAFSPAGAAAMQSMLEGQIGDLAGVVSGNATAQSAKDAEQDAAIAEAKSSAEEAQSSISQEKQLLEAQIQKAVPAGTVIAFAANSTPSGYLLCNGAAVSRTTYADLFAAIGTTYGTGDGSTTFNLPNLTDRFIQGSGTAGTVREAGLPNIYGQIAGTRMVYSMVLKSGAFSESLVNGANAAGYAAGSGDMTIDFRASKSNAIYGKSYTVQPPAVTMRYYIKY